MSCHFIDEIETIHMRFALCSQADCFFQVSIFSSSDRTVKYKTFIAPHSLGNKAGYTATLVACGWAGAVLERVTRAPGQEPYV